MPSRRSDRGRALAKAIRENPELGKMMAELSEPYGTISAMSDIKDEPTNPMNYIYAMPVIGDAARFAGKGKKALDIAKKNRLNTGENMKDWLGKDMKQRQLDNQPPINMDQVNANRADYNADAAKRNPQNMVFDDVPEQHMDALPKTDRSARINVAKDTLDVITNPDSRAHYLRKLAEEEPDVFMSLEMDGLL